MKYGFYFRFYKKLHNDFICCVLSELAYMLYCIIYILKKITRKHTKSDMKLEQAQKIVNDVHPRLHSVPVYENKPINNELDLSIVIPVYNYADIIEGNILAALNQNTEYSYQIILVDDGSTDGAAEILRKYENNPKIKLIFQENAGIGAARNTGINNADGKYIMFIDCDDIVHNDIVQVLLDKAYSDDYDMVMCAHNLSKEKNGVVYERVPNVYSSRNLMGYKNGDKIMNLAGLPWCKVYKRELWNNVRFFPGYWYEDTIIQFLIFTQCKHYAYVPKIEYEYKWYEKNFSHIQGNSANPKAIDSYWIVAEILEQYKKLALPVDDALYTLVLRHMSSYYYGSIKNLDEKTVEALFVLAKDMCKQYKPGHKVKLPYMLKQVEKAFENNDIELWKLASSYQ
ncbi:MAG: glycosyltransferase family 2 protein [Ruminococcus sp.]